jgi:hypothetical protein
MLAVPSERSIKVLVCRCLAAMIALAALPSCKSPFRCFDQSTPQGSMPTSAQLWLGDTYQIDGTVWVDCERSVSTTLNWSAFIFSSEAPAVAGVNYEGLVTAAGVGETRVFIKYREGGVSTMTVLVSEPVASVSVSFSPTTPKVGDTVTVTMQALNAAGQPITVVQMDNKVSLRRNNVTTAWAFTPGPNQVSAKFVATQDGTYEVTSTAKRSVGTPRTGVAMLTVPAG